MELMSPEVYREVWFVFPLGLFIFVLILQILRKFLGDKKAFLCSLGVTFCVFLFLWNVTGLNNGTYVVTGMYAVTGIFASFGVGGSRRGGSSRTGGGGSRFGGGSSGGGGASGSW
ncbi:MAG: hypothetical protein RLZZ67_384 [Candidatus Parcubacteria bacterium]|jgi:uncharacterized membrane protein YgcG